MKTEFRNRAFLPIMMPLGLMAAIAATVGLFAWILLYNTKDGALVLAAVLATGALVSIALAASADKLDARRRAGVVVAMGVPLVLGIVLASTGGGVSDEALLNINREEINVINIPDANVTIHALSLDQFEQTTVTLPAGEPVAIIFQNDHIGTAHNVAYQPLVNGQAPEKRGSGDASGVSNTAPGLATLPMIFEDAPGDYFYWCTIHPSTMVGTLTLADGASPSAS